MSIDQLHDPDPTLPINEQASHWWLLLNSDDATSADHRAFSEWVTRSPERVKAYLQCARLAKALKSENIRWPDTPGETLIRQALQSVPEAVPLRAEQARPVLSTVRRTRPLRWAMAVMAIALTVALSVFFLIPQRYGTGIGEQRSVVLNDGSVITLNTASSIDVAF